MGMSPQSYGEESEGGTLLPQGLNLEFSLRVDSRDRQDLNIPINPTLTLL
jgi:hypothetical protein